MPTILDSNVVVDLLLIEPDWHEWSAKQISSFAASGPLVINPIVFAEAAPRFNNADALRKSMMLLGLTFEQLPWEAAFMAGKAHARYRRSGGSRERTLPDFLIGSHAQFGGYRLVTRDAQRYRTYFPNLEIIAPDSHP